jgi:hypothetical protein
MTELKVLKDKAVTAYKNAGADGRKLLSDLLGREVFSSDPKEYIKTFADVCDERGVVADAYRISGAINVFEQLKLQIQRLQLIAATFNGDWRADMANTSQAKYYPWFNVLADKAYPGGFRLSFRDYGYDHGLSNLGVRLYFKDSETATYVGKQFIGEYEGLMRIQQLINQS